VGGAMVLGNLFRFVRALLPLSAEDLLASAPHVPLVQFSAPSDAAMSSLWRVTTDGSELGGASHATLELVQEPSGEVPAFARFSGALSKVVGADQKRFRSGFAALRQSSDFDPPKPLGDMSHVRVILRTDGRPYVLNLKCDSYSHEDLYQSVMVVSPGSWHTLRIPLSEFRLTARGRLRECQRELDNARLQAVGVLLADEEDGPFCVDIASISAHADEDGHSGAIQ